MRMNFIDRGFGIYRKPGNDGASSAGLQGVGQDVTNATKQTDQEASQYGSSFDLGKILQQIFQGQLGLGSMPQGYLNPEQQYQNQGALNQSIYSNVLNQSQNPTAGWQSTLQPQLKQAQEQINSYYQKRGLLNSGIAIGDMGQAGVDLAIQNAQNEMAYQQQSLQNAQNLSGVMSGLENNNLSRLANLYGSQQQFGLDSLNRQATGAQSAAQYNAYPYEYDLNNPSPGYGQMLGTAAGAGLGLFLGKSPQAAMAGGQIGSSVGSGLPF